MTAEEVYGAWVFDKWTDRLGNNLPGGPFDSPTISLSMQGDQTICAQYVSPSGTTADAASDAMQPPVTTIFRGRREIQRLERW